MQISSRQLTAAALSPLRAALAAASILVLVGLLRHPPPPTTVLPQAFGGFAVALIWITPIAIAGFLLVGLPTVHWLRRLGHDRGFVVALVGACEGALFLWFLGLVTLGRSVVTSSLTIGGLGILLLAAFTGALACSAYRLLLEARGT